MRVAYVMPLPELGGGNKAIFHHAQLLADLGLEVTVMAQGPLPKWSRYRGSYVDYSSHRPRLSAQDLVVATYWPTIDTALALGVGPVAHFCQGYEGGLEHLADQRQEIEAAYSKRLPTIAVSPFLAEFVERRFGREARVVSPAADPLFRPQWWSFARRRPRARPWIAVAGAFEAPVKGVAVALEALHELRRRQWPVRVLRFSPLMRVSEERALLDADRYLGAVDPKEVARALRGCDLLLFASRSEEGFGLPVLEAMASGVPVVAAPIPSIEYMAGEAVITAEPAARSLANAAERLLGDRSSWLEMRRRGLEAARRFSEKETAARLFSAVQWAAGREPKS